MVAEADRPVVFALSPCRRLVASVVGVQRGVARLGRFANGELHARVETRVAGRDCLIVGSISPPEARIAQVTPLAHALRRAGASSVAAVLPYLAYARQDRADAGEGLGLAWAGGLLRASGVDRVVTVDVHSDAAPGLLGMPLASLRPTGLLAAALPAEWTSEGRNVRGARRGYGGALPGAGRCGGEPAADRLHEAASAAAWCIPAHR